MATIALKDNVIDINGYRNERLFVKLNNGVLSDISTKEILLDHIPLECTINVHDGVIVNLEVNGNVTCGDVAGYISADGDVTVTGNIEKNVSSGGNIKCNDIGGNATAEGDIEAHDISGDANGHNMTCNNIEGNVSAEGDVTCNEVAGDINCNYNVDVTGNVGGNINCDGDATCSDVGGSVNCNNADIVGTVEGDLIAEGSVSIKR